MNVLNRSFRKIYRRYHSAQNWLNLFKYKLVGQISIGPKASVESGAVIDLTYNNKRNWVVEIGANSRVKAGAYIAPRSGFIKIGKGCSINRNCILLGYGGISIGDNVRIAANTSIIAFNHNFEDVNVPVIEQGNRFEGITLGDDVWVGSGARILDGVSVGQGAVIGAGSVVTKNIEPYSVVAGVPAKLLKVRS